jgi:hypothetical protein
MAAPVLDSTAALTSVAAGMPAGLVASLAGARLGAWLGEVGRGPTRVPAGPLPGRAEQARLTAPGALAAREREVVAR